MKKKITPPTYRPDAGPARDAGPASAILALFILGEGHAVTLGQQQANHLLFVEDSVLVLGEKKDTP